MDHLEPVTDFFAAKDAASTPKSPRTLNSGWDEEKCRNVLVRYCDHIPRNYQYRDGIQKIFLILRDHMGDENLDLAGGVLYELIEVDCQRTDDPGAAFQRWRFHHMQRHADLELPHVPHMTTITSAIRPTAALTLWRECHPSRYPIRLSDASPSSSRNSAEPSALRSHRPWMIDNTMWVSSRHEGTRPVRRFNPTEFHEMQWNPDFGRGGKLVEEKVIYPLEQGGRPQPGDQPACTRANLEKPCVHHRRKKYGRKSKGQAKLKKALPGCKSNCRLQPLTQKPQKTVMQERVRQSWFSSILGFDTVVSLKDFLDNRVVNLPSRIPNAIFARKYNLVEEDMPLYYHIPIGLMPTAEACVKKCAAMNIAQQAARQEGELSRPPEFNGPLTPQLWYDGGLDFCW